MWFIQAQGFFANVNRNAALSQTHISDAALVRDPARHHLGADDGHV